MRIKSYQVATCSCRVHLKDRRIETSFYYSLIKIVLNKQETFGKSFFKGNKVLNITSTSKRWYREYWNYRDINYKGILNKILMQSWWRMCTSMIPSHSSALNSILRIFLEHCSADFSSLTLQCVLAPSYILLHIIWKWRQLITLTQICILSIIPWNTCYSWVAKYFEFSSSRNISSEKLL